MQFIYTFIKSNKKHAFLLQLAIYDETLTK